MTWPERVLLIAAMFLVASVTVGIVVGKIIAEAEREERERRRPLDPTRGEWRGR